MSCGCRAYYIAAVLARCVIQCVCALGCICEQNDNTTLPGGMKGVRIYDYQAAKLSLPEVNVLNKLRWYPTGEHWVDVWAGILVHSWKPGGRVLYWVLNTGHARTGGKCGRAVPGAYLVLQQISNRHLVAVPPPPAALLLVFLPALCLKGCLLL